MSGLADLPTPAHVLHMRRSRVMIPADFRQASRDRTATWKCYGTFDRLLITESDTLAPPSGATSRPAPWGKLTILFPLGGCGGDSLIDEAARWTLVGVHHIKFERTTKKPRPERFDTRVLRPLLDALQDGDQRRLALCASLHWHERVLFTFSDDVERIFTTGVALRQLRLLRRRRQRSQRAGGHRAHAERRGARVERRVIMLGRHADFFGS